MDFSNHPLNSQSIIDNRLKNKQNQSIIDYQHHRLKTLLKDENLGKGFVAKAVQHLSEADIDNFADYALRKGNHPGRAFVGLCRKALTEKGVV